MENQISKQAIVDYLKLDLEFSNRRLDDLDSKYPSHSEMSSYEHRWYQRSMTKSIYIERLIAEITNGMFDDEDKFNELQKLQEWRKEAHSRDDSFTVEELTKQITKLTKQITK